MELHQVVADHLRKDGCLHMHFSWRPYTTPGRAATYVAHPGAQSAGVGQASKHHKRYCLSNCV